MAKYHIKADGTPGVCRATTRPCPLGGDEAHYDTMEEAYEASQEMLSREFDLLGSKSELDKAELALIQYYKEGGESTPLEYIRKHGSLFDIDNSEKEALAREFGERLWESDELSNLSYDGKKSVYIDDNSGLTKEDLEMYKKFQRNESEITRAKRWEPEKYEKYMEIKNKYDLDTSFGGDHLTLNFDGVLDIEGNNVDVVEYEAEMGMSTEEVFDKYGYLPSKFSATALEESIENAKSSQEIIKNNIHKPYSEWEEKPEYIAVKRDNGNIAMYQIEHYGDGKDLMTKSMDGNVQHVRFRGSNEVVPMREMWHVGDVKAHRAATLLDEGLVSAEVV